MKNEITCYLCDEDFEYEDFDTDLMSDIEEGQYVEFEVVRCPHCGMTIRA